ncbi:putative DNA polymerase alpha subunit B [Blattamonas nauphoetae]|uniref:DNA polymerase alpha subunit B n=1 Tax=Blattamonas nauphoetae TaxID=2049346 RepID=A0ABQ9Y170_9EUKA|nr:putative DNA polymerase alpha subunit B [Blattamonas nauphoetae]
MEKERVNAEIVMRELAFRQFEKDRMMAHERYGTQFDALRSPDLDRAGGLFSPVHPGQQTPSTETHTFQIDETFQPHAVPEEQLTQALSVPVSIDIGSYDMLSVEYGCTSLRAAFQVRHKEIRDLIKELDGTNAERANFDVPNPDERWYFGRIVSASPNVDKLNVSDILLEGGNGKCASLIFSNQFAVFPGQFVAVKGILEARKQLIVTELIDGVLPPHPNHDLDHHRAPDGMEIITAQGPFLRVAEYLSDNVPDPYPIDFSSFESLIAHVYSTKPQVVVLFGPFVDPLDPIVQRCNSMGFKTPEELFDELLKIIAGLAQDLTTQFILVPHTKDLAYTSGLPFVPMTPFDVNLEKFLPVNQNQPTSYHIDTSVNSLHIHLVPNPAFVTINNVEFLLMSEDILFHINKRHCNKVDISNKNGPSSDTFTTLCSYLLKQRSIFPLASLPTPPPQSYNTNMPTTQDEFESLRMSAADHTQTAIFRISEAPHVVIVPSILKHFVRRVDETVFINPGSFRQNKKIASISIAPAGRITTAAANEFLLKQQRERNRLMEDEESEEDTPQTIIDTQEANHFIDRIRVDLMSSSR